MINRAGKRQGEPTGWREFPADRAAIFIGKGKYLSIERDADSRKFCSRHCTICEHTFGDTAECHSYRHISRILRHIE